jgi:2-oxoglutarate ferredoxin oxidoreductase subunit alpha
MALSFLDGNEAIARAALRAGCSFFAGYPITPATSIYQHMLNLLPPSGGTCLQGEDEIASIGFCLGASMAGKKVLTATSGPGISLYSEQISFAIGGEIPIVIVDVQRLGPSTGSATRGADGDIQFLRWGNSGGLPVIVLAPVDTLDCYTLTLQAFKLAERYRCPVFIASNKEVAMTRESVDLVSIDIPEPEYRVACPADELYLPFCTPPGSNTPYFLPIGSTKLVRQTSSTHGPDGYITVNRQVITGVIERMARKLEQAVDDFSFYELDSSIGADTLLVVYGVTARAAKEAVERLRNRGVRLSLLILKTLYPVPEKLLRTAIRDFSKVVMVEMNLGQYVREIERLAGTIPVQHYGQMDGELISPEKIMEVIGS